eukprot:scaffold5326_cov136-Isochrysis_galbana.AAC.3
MQYGAGCGRASRRGRTRPRTATSCTDVRLALGGCHASCEWEPRASRERRDPADDPRGPHTGGDEEKGA